MRTKTKKNCTNCEHLEINNSGGAECIYHKNDKCSPRSLQMHKSKKITNLEWARNLSDKEFIKFMFNFSEKHCSYCDYFTRLSCIEKGCVSGVTAWFNNYREED